MKKEFSYVKEFIANYEIQEKGGNERWFVKNSKYIKLWNINVSILSNKKLTKGL